MADPCPDKKEIEQIFNRLRSITANKVCFDCSAKNPTWSSVTYGVFICIDCSAVHRSLGVHLTFVRSTQLDTNWTWLQIRQMQLGGNANASQFFRQHNCVSTDAQQKYNSRVASLYRDKLKHLAQQAMNAHGTKLHLDAAVEQAPPQSKEVDFFDKSHDEDGFSSNNIEIVEPLQSLKQSLTPRDSENQVGPSVDGVAAAGDRKPTIGVRKIQPKRSGLGGKKGGMGATKVKTNFADIEREANMNDQLREQAVVDRKQNAVTKDEDNEKAMTNMRLAYQDLSMQQSKEEQRVKAIDPRKAQQVERLGMGFANTRSAVSHSALSDMKTIEQENLDKGSSSTGTIKTTFERDNDFFDDFSFSSGNMYSTSRSERDIQNIMDRSSTSSKSSGGWEIIEPESSSNVRSMFSQDDKPKTKAAAVKSSASEDAAQKKFGNVKSISSDQYFNEGASTYERNANLQRFQGSNSISSADYFGDGTSSTNRRNTGGGGGGYSGPQFQTPDLDDVKESVRQGVTKVAGKLSSLANGVMTSLQDKYGY